MWLGQCQEDLLGLLNRHQAVLQIPHLQVRLNNQDRGPLLVKYHRHPGHHLPGRVDQRHEGTEGQVMGTEEDKFLPTIVTHQGTLPLQHTTRRNLQERVQVQ